MEKETRHGKHAEGYKDNRKGDRHKPGYKRPTRKKKEKTEWAGTFTAIDGEGWEGKYTLLACSALSYDLYNPEGLSTRDCFEYLTSWGISPRNAVVGYGLSYDYENILRDIPDDLYQTLLTGERVEWEEFELSYVPRKILEIKRDTGRETEKGKKIFKTVFIQDVLGFFQASFEAALKKWEIESPPIIKEGKALREKFNQQPIEFIKKYNREELRLIIELMEKLKAADYKAFQEIGLKPNHSPRIWFGPGARANNFLMQTLWNEEHPEFTGPIFEQLQSEAIANLAEVQEEEPTTAGLERVENLKANPFAAAFYGGRIEAAAMGFFKEPLFDYDINSAYPFAVSNLPKWNPEDLERVEGFDPGDRIGMYYVKWNCREESAFYPFPYRSQSGNVFFPRSGAGWYMSPEVNAARDVWGSDINVVHGYVLRGTDGAGNGLVKLPEHQLSTTALYMDKIAKLRLKAKAAKDTSEKALKLIMNSCYGKTIQQIGSHKYLNTFAASWITATCRAIICRTVGKDQNDNIVSIMTDGILSRVPLAVDLGKNLGQFDKTCFDSAYQFMPGVYLLEDSTGNEKSVSRFRGMNKDFEPKKAFPVLYKKVFTEHYTDDLGKKKTRKTGGIFPVHLNVFVTRGLALHQPTAYGDKKYFFVPLVKNEDFSLSSKRLPGKKGFRLLTKEKYHFFPAKESNPMEVLFFGGSTPYKLDLPVLQEYDTAETEEEMLAGNRIGSILTMALENE